MKDGCGEEDGCEVRDYCGVCVLEREIFFCFFFEHDILNLTSFLYYILMDYYIIEVK